MIEVRKYSSDKSGEWNAFISVAKNATFMLDRKFIDYHQERFTDYSLMVYSDSKLIALLPANKNSETHISSHSGLTYGGIVVGEEIKLNMYLRIFRAIMQYLNCKGICELDIKVMPDFYSVIPAQEYQYAFFLVDAKRTRVDTSLTIDQNNKVNYQNRRKRSVKKAKKGNFIIKKNNDFKVFWDEVLTPNLMERFGTKPVHSLKEIMLLANLFPENISQVNVYENDRIVAGATIFETDKVAHAQYISGNEYGRKSGALDLLFDQMISEIYVHRTLFDFGICNEQNGMFINHGLLDWKEGFGGRTFVHEFYRIDTSRTKKIDAVIIS